MFDVLIIDPLGNKHNFRDADQISTTDAAGKTTILDPKNVTLDDIQDTLTIKIVDKSNMSFPKEDIQELRIKLEDF